MSKYTDCFCSFHSRVLELIINMLKVIVLALFLSLVVSYNFPTYKQCDSKWGS